MAALLPELTITGATSGVTGVLLLPAAPRNLALQANFEYGSGGTSVDLYVQTSTSTAARAGPTSRISTSRPQARGVSST